MQQQAQHRLAGSPWLRAGRQGVQRGETKAVAALQLLRHAVVQQERHRGGLCSSCCHVQRRVACCIQRQLQPRAAAAGVMTLAIDVGWGAARRQRCTAGHLGAARLQLRSVGRLDGPLMCLLLAALRLLVGAQRRPGLLGAALSRQLLQASSEGLDIAIRCRAVQVSPAWPHAPDTAAAERQLA